MVKVVDPKRLERFGSLINSDHTRQEVMLLMGLSASTYTRWKHRWKEKNSSVHVNIMPITPRDDPHMDEIVADVSKRPTDPDSIRDYAVKTLLEQIERQKQTNGVVDVRLISTLLDAAKKMDEAPNATYDTIILNRPEEGGSVFN